MNQPKKTNDLINHPKHYNELNAPCRNCGIQIECIDVVSVMSFSLGNAIKYIWRCNNKDNKVEDLKKAIWYLQNEIAKAEGHTEQKERRRCLGKRS